MIGSLGILASWPYPLVTSASYADEVLADSPVGHWRLDDSSGTTAVDSSGNGRDGLRNGATYNQSGLINDGTCYDFDGSNDRVYFNDAAWMDTEFTDKLTVEAWINLDAYPPSGDYSCIVARYQGGLHGRVFLMRVNNDGTVSFIVWPNGVDGAGSASTTVCSIGTTYHVVGTYDGAYTNIYVNGSEEAPDDAGAVGSFAGETLNMFIGAMNNGTHATADAAMRFFNGRIDEVAIYNTALSPARIAAHYQAGSGA